MTVLLRVLALFGLSPASALFAAGIAIGAVALAGGIWISGKNYAERKCEAAALRAELQAKQVDLDAANKAAGDREDALAEISRARGLEQKRILEYEQRLKANPACLLTDDDWRAVDGVREPARRRSR